MSLSPGAQRLLYTTAALVAFAANSLLCRLALAGRAIDAASFTSVRLLAGACVLGLLSSRRPRAESQGGSWGAALALFCYAAAFSYAYLRLGAGLGALILFGCVQATMIGVGIVRGERPQLLSWLGVALALSGLVRLALPFATQADALGGCAMALAGVSWGLYSLQGSASSGDPLRVTAANFARSVPLALALVLLAALRQTVHASTRGLVLALVSGALASGLGYSLWYAALRKLAATQAAALQLLVPILAAVGGLVLLDEQLTPKLLVGGTLVLGGVGLALHGTKRA